MPETLLIVRHGPGRGRIPRYGDHILDWLRRERPDLHGRISVHETGSGEVSIDGVCAVCFWLADPLELKYPHCYREARRIQDEAEDRSLPMINRPTALARYGKSLQAARFEEAAIPTPRAIPIDEPRDLYACAEELGVPVLIRGGQSFSQQGSFIVRDRSAIRSLERSDLPNQAVVTSLLDVRGRRPANRRGDLWSRYHHRMRTFLIGRECAPYSLFFSRHPLVSQATSLYTDYDTWRRKLRGRGWMGRQALRVIRRGLGMPRAVQLEREFTRSAVAQADLFRQAGEAVGLEFLAFDYASLPGGRLVVWEANPHPYLPPASKTLLSHTRDSATNILGVYRAIERCFDALLETSRSW